VAIDFDVVLPQDYTGTYEATSINIDTFTDRIQELAVAQNIPALANFQVSNVQAGTPAITETTVSQPTDGARPMVSIALSSFVVIILTLAGREFA